MGYDIFYDKAFIRINTGDYKEDKFIPVLQHGANNCWQFGARGQEIPEKDWSSWSYTRTGKGNVICDKEEITRYGVEFGNPSSYGDLPFKARRRQFDSPMQASRWFWNGMKTAMTVEQYVEYGNTIRVVDTSEAYPHWKHVGVKTTEELVETINIIGQTKCYVEFTGRILYRPKKLKVHHEPIPVDHFFVVKFDGQYVNKLTSRRLRYSRWMSDAKKHVTEKSALAYMTRVQASYGHKHDVAVERINKQDCI